MRDFSITVIGSDKLNELIDAYEDAATVHAHRPDGFEDSDLIESLESEFEALGIRVYVEIPAIDEEMDDVLGAEAVNRELTGTWYE